ncbi:hypothetical protein TGAMA5MH_09218 [Trichoderma gamsii]|uniref:DUF4139 domain-containing protein n=1 Tax=Trichoderma gamsii TaxID=398673 RepID=A0A2K0T0E6_9HYPO|nr:hypothetical protein TGAMA5MH_09218 [Trichoderma gamsii]
MAISTPFSEEDSVHKIEYLANDINTSSVTLFPSRAQVRREIKAVQLKHGTNQITIVGLSQTLDPDSIRVESNGTATVTNLEVEEVPNRQLFDEVYPEIESEPESESETEEVSDDDARPESSHLTAARHALSQLNDKLDIARDGVCNAERRLGILEDISNLGNTKGVDFIQITLNHYKEQRAKACQDMVENRKLVTEITKDVEKAEKTFNKLQKEEAKKNEKRNKAKTKARKEKEKKKAFKDRIKGEANRERARLRREQERFWPLNVYSVCITLEVAAFTPASSRRGSIASDVDVSLVSATEVQDEAEKPGSVESDLVFSYVTSSAYWMPNYDLQLSTTNASGSLFFDAMLTNRTSETWKNCKVTLSTSQATFSGLDDKIPNLDPWRIGITSGYAGRRDEDKITWSSQEMVAMNRAKHQAMMHQAENAAQTSALMVRKMTPRKVKLVGDIPPPPPPAASRGSSLFGPQSTGFSNTSNAAATGGGLFGSVAATTAAAGGLFGSAAPAAPLAQPSSFGSRAPIGPPGGLFRSSEPTVEGVETQPEQINAAEVEKPPYDDDATYDASLMEETGLTTTYDLPGLKTLAPKINGSKQRVARIPFANVVFSHTVVAKYKAVAYLSAKLKNNSKVALLKGDASLTLDGTFMGKTSLPRCSSGESFTLGLGIDPAIKVTYAKPEVHRTSSGLFSKEDSAVYVRTVTLHNTRAVGGRAVDLLVQDQVPVSEDERLRVELLYPRGLVVDSNNGVATGAAEKEGQSKDDGSWGKATAKLKKEGQLRWDVSLNAGKAVKLTLEYSVSMPGGHSAYQVHYTRD